MTKIQIRKYIFIIIFIAAVLLCGKEARAATEFVSTIRATGGDYSMLSTWEAAVQSNLTASTTVVYSGTGTGGLPAGAVLELFRAGVYQNITASTTATTTTQILVNSFSGAYKVLQDGDEWRVASSTDDTGTAVIGWTTSVANYIKIYTTASARHQGKWSEGRYIIGGMTISENYVRVDGLQILKNITTTGTYRCLGVLTIDAGGTDIYISNNITKMTVSSGNTSSILGIQVNDADVTNVKIWNNIVYDIIGDATSLNVGISLYGGNQYVYNNTVQNCGSGIAKGAVGIAYAKNNLVASSTICFSGTFNSASTNNAGSDATYASSTADRVSQTFTFADEANDDFHLAGNDSAARNAGTDLSADANLPFTDDIDGQTRAGTWDIGADEATENIYRSVGPSKTTALAVGTSNALTISDSTATFASGLPDNVGVGDALQYDDDGDSDIDADDSIVFIYSRTSSSTYEVKTASGAIPTAVAGDTDWSLFRAYTSLAKAETGTENTGIDADLVNFDTWTLGKDISSSTGSNEQWNIACYANETTADTAAVTISGWTTTADNYIKIYTPTASSEVGTSQRHGGKAGTGYRLITTVSNVNGLNILEDHVRIEGLEIQNTNTYNNSMHGISFGSSTGASNTDIRIIGCLIHDCISPTGYEANGIMIAASGAGRAGNIFIINNIIYNNKTVGIRANTNYAAFNAYAYNNTLINNGDYGIRKVWFMAVTVKNCISMGHSVADYYANTGSISKTTTLSSDGTGSVDLQYKDVVFTDETNDDFHLAPNDYSAINAGTNLSADSYLAFTDDIDGETRPISTGWDIGADESYLTKFKFNNGTFKIRGTIKFE
jgi:hypothetical protein